MFIDAFPEAFEYNELLSKLVVRFKPFNFSDEISVSLIVGGLKTHPEIEASVKDDQYPPCRSLLKVLKTYGNAAPRKSNLKYDNRRSIIKAKIQSHSNKENRICFNCNSPEHIASQCLTKKNMSQCLTKPTEQQINKINHVIDNKYFKLVKINKHAINAFADLGSTTMLINPTTLENKPQVPF